MFRMAGHPQIRPGCDCSSSRVDHGFPGPANSARGQQLQQRRLAAARITPCSLLQHTESRIPDSRFEVQTPTCSQNSGFWTPVSRSRLQLLVTVPDSRFKVQTTTFSQNFGVRIPDSRSTVCWLGGLPTRIFSRARQDIACAPKSASIHCYPRVFNTYP